MGGASAASAVVQLSLLDHEHPFNDMQQDAYAAEGSKAAYWPSATRDCSVILCDGVAQILVFEEFYRRVKLGIEGL